MWSDAADVYFSNLVIPIGKNVFLGIVLFCVLLAAHEAHVAAGARPLFANHERSHNVPLQVVIVLSWIIMLMNVALLVPVSLDFSLAMGQSATASGVFIGGGTAFSVAGLIAGKPLTSEVNWNQRLARGIFLVCNSLCFWGNFANVLCGYERECNANASILMFINLAEPGNAIFKLNHPEIKLVDLTSCE